jgi:hypothetical protein
LEYLKLWGAVHGSNIMKHELWTNEGGLDLFCLAGPRGDSARKMLEPDYRLVWICDADSHFEAMKEYYAFRNWGEYQTDFLAQDSKTYKELGWE